MVRLLLILSFICLPAMAVRSQGLREQIEKQNDAMEKAFAAGDMEKVAWYYLDEAVMLSPGGDPVRGRKEIDAYWARISNPVSWELEVIEVSTEEEDIYENEYYQALEDKPPSWRMEGVEIDADDRAVVYQLGRSTLITKQDGRENKSIVEFILVWKYTAEGYRILIDTYSW